MAFKMGSCKGCQQRREALVKGAGSVKQFVAKYVAKPKGKK